RHQLKIIDHDEIELLLFSRQAASLRSHLQNRNRSRVIDEDARVSQTTERLSQPRPFLIREITTAELLSIHTRLRAEHAHRQRLCRHFQREDADHRVAFNRRVLRKRQRETRLTHRRPRRDYYQILFLQTGSQRIEPSKACRHAGYDQVSVLNGFGFFEHALGRMLDVFEALADAFISQREYRMLRMIENVLRLVFLFERFRGDLFCDLDQLAQLRFSTNYFRELHDARDVQQTVGEIRKKQDHARLIERVVAPQFFRNQDWINFSSTFEQRGHRDKDSAVRGHV